MYSFDASSIIHAWDTYPPANPHFDSLWKWMARQIDGKQFSISSTALEEVGRKIPECEKWLKGNNIEIFPLTSSILSIAQKIKPLLDIKEMYGSGVGENDLLIIATAKETRTTLVTEEAWQKSLPKKKPKYKIPAVCRMREVNIKCISFIKLLK